MKLCNVQQINEEVRCGYIKIERICCCFVQTLRCTTVVIRRECFLFCLSGSGSNHWPCFFFLSSFFFFLIFFPIAAELQCAAKSYCSYYPLTVRSGRWTGGAAATPRQQWFHLLLTQFLLGLRSRLHPPHRVFHRSKWKNELCMFVCVVSREESLVESNKCDAGINSIVNAASSVFTLWVLLKEQLWGNNNIIIAEVLFYEPSWLRHIGGLLPYLVLFHQCNQH